MTVSLIVNGTTYDYPETGDTNWGPDATDWASAVTSGMLQKAGGLFTLLAEVDFGATYGLKSEYYKSRSSNVASSGVLRLATSDELSWRNNANDNDLTLGVNASDNLTFNGSEIQSAISVSDTSTIDLTLAASVLTASIIADSITNAEIASNADIAYSKLDLADSITNADINSSAAIEYSKLDLADSIQVSDLDNTELTGSGNIVLDTSPTIQAPVIDDYLDLEAVSPPSTPSSGYGRMYVSSDGKLNFINDDGITQTLGEAGSGEINVIANPNDASQGWTSSNGSNITVTTTTTSTDLPLGPVVGTAIKITPISGTDYVYYRWTMPAALKNTLLKLQWEQRPLSGYATGDLQIEVYKNSASNYSGSYTEFPLSTDDTSGDSLIPNYTGSYTTTFDSDDGDYYELRVVRNSGTTALNIVSVICGPGIQPQGAVVDPVETVTLSGSNFTNDAGLTITGRASLQRVGDSLDLRISAYFSGTGSNGSPLQFTLPTYLGQTITPASGSFAGGRGNNQGSGDNFTLNLYVRGDGTNSYLEFADSNAPTTSLNGTSFGGSTNQFDSIDISALIPITQWQGNGTVNLAQNGVLYGFNTSVADANNSTDFGYGPQGTEIQTGTLTAARTRLVRFPFQVGNAWIQVSSDRQNWVDFTQTDVNISGGGRFHNLDQASGLGFGISAISGTDVTVSFEQYRTSGSINWTSGLGYWRVVASPSGVAVGFGQATSTSLGLVKEPQKQMVTLDTLAGLSSNNTAIPYYTNVVDNSNGAFTVANSSSDGVSFTIQQAGYYYGKANWNSSGSGSPTIGFSKNADSSQMDAQIQDMTVAQGRLGWQSVASAAANMDLTASIMSWFDVGDVVRPHAIPGQGTTTAYRCDVFFMKVNGVVA